ncbi:MAG: phosphotransferase enzyme family protein [Candidatus Methylacidiphilales bacterium]
MKTPTSDFLAQLLDCDPASIRFISFSQNAVYEFTDWEGVPRILRLTCGSHRKRYEVESELNWVEVLHGAGKTVCPPVRWKNGMRVMSFIPDVAGEEEDTWHAVIFQKAAGRALEKDDLSETLYEKHGKTLGALHEFSRHRPRCLEMRCKWYAERYFTRDVGTYLAPGVARSVRAAWRQIRADLLPHCKRTRRTYGPVHLDLGYSNFFLSGDHLEVFDFDNSCRSYYAYDIALALYGGLFTRLRCEFAGDRSAFDHPKSSVNLQAVWNAFRRGYESQTVWLEEWNLAFPLWFEVAYFRAVLHAFRVQHPVTNPRVQALLDADIENILNRQPPVRFDFSEGKAMLS